MQVFYIFLVGRYSIHNEYKSQFLWLFVVLWHIVAILGYIEAHLGYKESQTPSIKGLGFLM